jgi:hypothetical protein
VTVTVEGSLIIANYTRSSAAISGGAVIPLEDTANGGPDSVWGTFTVDGTQYGLVEIMRALSGGDGNDSLSHTPVPAMFAIASQKFQCRAWRPAPAQMADRWSTYEYITIAISSDGATHAVSYQDGAPGFAGFVDWHTVGAQQKLDLANAAGQVQHSFNVLEYDRNHLRMQMQWGAEMEEFLFSAGTANLTGLVVDGTDELQVGYYIYNPPIAGATVQFGTYTGSFEPLAGVADCTTDSAGFFAFSDLVLPQSYEVWLRVVKAGYSEQFATVHSVESVSDTSGAFVWVGMSPQ